MWIIPKNYKLPSAFAQAMVESKEDLILLESTIESSLMWRSKPSQFKTWCQRWNRVSWMQHLFTRILKPSHQRSFEEQLTLSLGAILVSRSAKLAKDKVKKTQDTFGRTSENTLTQLDLLDVCLKMSKDTSRLDSPQLSATWKKMVTEQRGVYSQRQKLVQDTKEKESLLWPTPTTQEIEHPNAVLTNSGRRLSKNGKTSHSLNLADTVKREIFPTPTVGEEKFRLQGSSQASKCLEAKARKGELQQDMKMSLNPYWVEALMGLPQGWTALDGTETEMQGTWEDSSWEEGIPRVTKGCLNRVDRIRMCGNGVVPQTAALAWKVLSDRLEG